VCHDISPENLALFFLGDQSEITTTLTAVTGEVHDDVQPGTHLQLGQSDTAPSGAKGLVEVSPGVNIIVEDDTTPTPVTFTEGDDYEVDMERGRIYIIAGGLITAGTNLRIDYTVGAATRDQVISGSSSVEGALRFLSFNPAGKDREVYLPRVKMTPNGDFALLSGDEAQVISMNIQVLKHPQRPAIIVDGKAIA
jgi:hypothetical protein